MSWVELLDPEKWPEVLADGMSTGEDGIDGIVDIEDEGDEEYGYQDEEG